MTVKMGQRPNLDIERWKLWYAFVSGPVVWAIHLVTVYPLHSVACHWGFLTGEILGMAALRFVMIVMTILAAGLVLLGIFLARENWRRLDDQLAEGELTVIEARMRFMVRSGFYLNIAFLVAILGALIPILSLELCRF